MGCIGSVDTCAVAGRARGPDTVAANRISDIPVAVQISVQALDRWRATTLDTPVSVPSLSCFKEPCMFKRALGVVVSLLLCSPGYAQTLGKIGRASCRERG